LTDCTRFKKKYSVLIGVLIMICLSVAAVSADERELAGKEMSFLSDIRRDVDPPASRFSLAIGRRSDRDGKDGEGEEEGRQVKLVRAVIQYFSLLAYSWPNHWSTYPDRKEEWAYDWTWEDQLERTFTLNAWRFDCNAFATNSGHSIAGALYYTAGRSNNMNIGQSFLFNLGGTLFWEYVPEWRQVLAINDCLFNIFGAIPLGETLFQMSKYFENKKGLVYKILGILNPFGKINSFLDRKKSRPWLKTSGAEKFEFDFSGGGVALWPAGAQSRRSAAWLGMRMRMRAFPDERITGASSGWHKKVTLAEGFWNLTFDREDLQQSHARFIVDLFSLTHQNLDERGDGFAFSLGISTAYTYFRLRPLAFYDTRDIRPKHGVDLELDKPREFTDKFAAVHMGGLRLDYCRFLGDLRFRIGSAAYLDFALVNAFALNDYSIENDISGVKTTLLYFGYYYAWGASLYSNLSLEYRNLALEGWLWMHLWDSIEGRDRFQPEIRDDFDINDQRVHFSVILSYSFPMVPVGLRLRYEMLKRSGEILGTRRSNTIANLAGGIVIRF
jgi:hypothetical protein